MNCQHNFIRDIRTSEPFWVCEHCGLELAVDHYQALEQVRRKGWEQAKREAIEVISNRPDFPNYRNKSIDTIYRAACGDVGDAIAAMEYKEPTND